MSNSLKGTLHLIANNKKQTSYVLRGWRGGNTSSQGHTRYAAMTTEPKSGKTLPLYINAQSASVAPAETERKGKRLRVAEGRYAAFFPQERPLDGAQIIAWDENGNLLGIGFGRDTRDTGVAIIVNGKKYDSNHVIHWCS